jgi:hypothetical protein
MLSWTQAAAVVLSSSFMDQLNPVSSNVAITLTTMHGRSTSETKAVCGLRVSDLDGWNQVELPVMYERDLIPVDVGQVPRPELLARWAHLRKVAEAMPHFRPDLEIGLLVGCNAPLALEPLEVVSCDNANAPVAMRTRFGWTVIGPMETTVDGSFVRCHRVAIQEAESFKEVVVKALERDFDEKPRDRESAALSIEDKKFLAIMDEGMMIDDENHYVLPLPFRESPSGLPSNYEQAKSRALSQRVKMLKNAEYRGHYAAFMTQVLAKGYAREVPDSLSKDKARYLPHHGVYHPRKPGKLRVVFDCSAKHCCPDPI